MVVIWFLFDFDLMFSQFPLSSVPTNLFFVKIPFLLSNGFPKFFNIISLCCFVDFYSTVLENEMSKIGIFASKQLIIPNWIFFLWCTCTSLWYSILIFNHVTLRFGLAVWIDTLMYYILHLQIYIAFFHESLHWWSMQLLLKKHGCACDTLYGKKNPELILFVSNNFHVLQTSATCKMKRKIPDKI